MVILFEKIESAENIADMNTKPLGKIKFTYHLKRALGGEDLHYPNSKRLKTKQSKDFV